MNRSLRSSRTTRVLAATGVAGVLIAVTAALAAGQGGDEHGSHEHGSHEHGSVEAVAAELAAGQARDRAELNADLTAAGELAHEQLAQVLREMAAAVPVEGAGSPDPATASDVDRWREDLAVATAALGSVGEGTSEQTVVREAFVGAAHLLQAAAAEYEHLLSVPADEPRPPAATVGERRDAAVRLWQAGAAQLDTLTIESGDGHVHLFLAPNGDPGAVPEEFREPEDQNH